MKKHKQGIGDAGAHGARRARVDEPLGWAETYPIQWREPRVDFAELAKLRWIEDWSRKELAKKFGKTEGAVQNYFQALKQRHFQIQGLSELERQAIKLKVSKD